MVCFALLTHQGQLEFECWLFLEDYIHSAFFFGGGILYFDLFNFPPSQECLLKLFSEFSSCYICHILNLDTRDLNGFSQTSLWKSLFTHSGRQLPVRIRFQQFLV